MREKHYTVHGRDTTLKIEAERIGVSVHALRSHMYSLGMGLEAVADLYDAGRIGVGTRGPEWHRVHGEWMTIAMAAERCGVSPKTLIDYRWAHRCLLEAACDHYMALKLGHERRGAREGRRHRVKASGRRPGGLMTVKEAAALLGVEPCRLYWRMARPRCMSLDAAVRAVEARQQRKAEREILRIMMNEE